MRRNLGRALLLCGLALPPKVWAAEIPRGAHLLLHMVNSVTTRTAQAGDYVYMRTASPVTVDDRIVIPVNSYVQGIVAFARRGGKVSGRAQLGLELQKLTLPGGRTLKFTPSVRSVDSGGSGQKVAGEKDRIEQAPEHGRDAAIIAIVAGHGAALGALVDRSAKGAGIGAGAGGAAGLAAVMLTRGREVELRNGASLDVVLQQPLVIE